MTTVKIVMDSFLMIRMYTVARQLTAQVFVTREADQINTDNSQNFVLCLWMCAANYRTSFKKSSTEMEGVVNKESYGVI